MIGPLHRRRDSMRDRVQTERLPGQPRPGPRKGPWPALQGL